jgi:N-acetylneuraminic acid mutarotase
MRSLLSALLWLSSGLVCAKELVTESLPALTHAVSNNAVTLSFLGLGSGKTWQDLSSGAAVLEPGEENWEVLEPVPGDSGRLAASAVSAGGAAWVFGGYTVVADGSEKSIPGVYRIRPGETRSQWVTDMPVPVEDAVLFAYQDRYIYLVSGWHDLGNVNLVQVLDTHSMQWAQATPWPGAPVFGHSGGINEDKLLVCDGVRIQYPADNNPREFLSSDECWLGRIDKENHRRINWQSIPAHPGAARYRMAATGDDQNRVVFAGGSANPYNYNGIGYNGKPAEAEASVFSFNLESDEWLQHGTLPKGTMDHRGLLHADDWYYLVGGMQEHQTVVPDVYRFRIDAR